MYMLIYINIYTYTIYIYKMQIPSAGKLVLGHKFSKLLIYYFHIFHL